MAHATNIAGPGDRPLRDASLNSPTALDDGGDSPAGREVNPWVELFHLGEAFLACAGGIFIGFRLDDWLVAWRRRRWQRATVEDYRREEERRWI